jgi:hypothetical protein
MLMGLSVIMMSSSLFFSAQERSAIERLDHGKISQNPTEKEDLPLILNGILYRPDLNHWIVWINGIRIYSQRPQSIQGWTITKVSMDSVTLRSSSGEERELRPEQDPDLEDFNAEQDDDPDHSQDHLEDIHLDQSDQSNLENVINGSIIESDKDNQYSNDGYGDGAQNEMYKSTKEKTGFDGQESVRGEIKKPLSKNNSSSLENHALDPSVGPKE